MKIKLNFYVLLTAFVILASAPDSFAQKAKDALKYVPEAVTRKTVPYVVNPNSSPAARRGVAAFSEVAVERALETAASAQRGALSTSAVRMKGDLQAGGELKMPPARVLETPASSAQSHHLEFLTSLEALEKYQPQWRSDLRSAGFDEKQILQIEKAFVKTEKNLFEVDDNGIWLRPLSREWNYRDKFVWGEMSRIDFRTDQQVYIFEKFDDVFTHLNYQGFVLMYGRAPGKSTQLGKKVANLRNNKEVPIKLASEQVYEETLEHLRKTGKLPSVSSPVPAERALRRRFDRLVKKEEWVDPFIPRLKELQTLFGRSDRFGITDHD